MPTEPKPTPGGEKLTDNDIWNRLTHYDADSDCDELKDYQGIIDGVRTLIADATAHLRPPPGPVVTEREIQAAAKKGFNFSASHNHCNVDGPDFITLAIKELITRAGGRVVTREMLIQPIAEAIFKLRTSLININDLGSHEIAKCAADAILTAIAGGEGE